MGRIDSMPSADILAAARPPELEQALQRYNAPMPRPKPKAEDFVLSFELRKGDQMLAEGAAQLVSPPEDETDLESAPLWEPEDAPKVLRDDWELEPGSELSLWTTEPKPELSIFVTRDMRTEALYGDGLEGIPCEDGLEGMTGKIDNEFACVH